MISVHFHVVDRGANGGGAIDDHVQVHRRIDGGAAEVGHHRANAIDGVDHVGAGLAENDENDAGLAVGEAGVADVLDRIDAPEPISGKRTAAPAMSSDDQRLIFIGFEKLIGVGDAPGFSYCRRRRLWAGWSWPTAKRLRTVSRLMP